MKADHVTFLVVDDSPPANNTMGREDSWMADPVEWHLQHRAGAIAECGHGQGSLLA